jgi:hypothetical protein
LQHQQQLQQPLANEHLLAVDAAFMDYASDSDLEGSDFEDDDDSEIDDIELELLHQD